MRSLRHVWWRGLLALGLVMAGLGAPMAWFRKSCRSRAQAPATAGQEWLVPEKTPSGLCFREIDVARARLIGELQSGIGANDAG